MPIPQDDARLLLGRLGARVLANFAAQADARQVLFDVKEDPSNFPLFTTGLDERVTGIAYSFLAAGCSIIEQGDRAAGIGALERGARLLRNIYCPHSETSKEAAFHVLIASMAAYAAGQYSWAFVMLKKVKSVTDMARLVSAFLRRDESGLQSAIASVLLGSLTPDSEADLIETGITRAIARTLAMTMEFLYTGKRSYLDRSLAEIESASILASNGNAPVCWWMVRLLRLMLADLEAASFWTMLPPYFGEEAGLPHKANTFVRLLAFDRHRPVYELWRSQREALPQALGSNSGAVISLKTSSGKTRLAKLAMLQTLSSSPSSKVLFLAPFRSLAFEMEQTLFRVLQPLGYDVSHLYGGSRASRSESELVAESRVIIATPEKARALFRAAPELFSEIKLIVIDEGHLLGPDSRDVRNEMYYEHLRVRARRTGARILLLSAVLPNADQIAGWIAASAENLGTSDWRPSLQRFGLLKWNGKRVYIDWRGDYQSYNPRFVEAQPSSKRVNARRFPGNRNEAIAATAVRLWAGENPVMIFVAQARSVQPMATAALTALAFVGQSVEHAWPEREWKVFESICEEELPANAPEFTAARAGVICHSNSLPAQVRIAMEHLMRSAPPRIVIATNTLAQGVNLGVNTVIVASTLVDEGIFVKIRDFLNIAGRAGRAFVDVEGKILFALDETDPKKARQQEYWANRYFGGSPPDAVVSGVLQVISRLRDIAAAVGVNFERLLEMAAEDDFTQLADKQRDADGYCSLLDDALLSLHEDDALDTPTEPAEEWVDALFRDSLGVLQATAAGGQSGATPKQIIGFLKARAAVVLRLAPTPERRKAVVSSSLPFKVALRVLDGFEEWYKMVDDLQAAGESPQTMVVLLAQIEAWAKDNAKSLVKGVPGDGVLAKVREGWLKGVPLRELCGGDRDAYAACRDYYGFTLTWLIHAASQEIRASGDSERADVLARCAQCVELGLPTELACRIFLAGIRSRAVCVELSEAELGIGGSIRSISLQLRDIAENEALATLLSAKAASWLSLLSRRRDREVTSVPGFVPFTVEGIGTDEPLFARGHDERVWLSSIDGRKSVKVVSSEELPFEVVANDPRYCFVFEDETWRLHIRDPRLDQSGLTA